MSRGPEAAFWKRVRRSWPGHAVRVEASNAEVEVGTPDTVLSIAYRGGWVELKVWPDNVSGEQLAWHVDAIERGAYAMVLSEMPDGSVWIGSAEEYHSIVRGYLGKVSFGWKRSAIRLPESRSLQAALSMIACGLTRSVGKKADPK